MDWICFCCVRYGFVTFESLNSVKKVESMGIIYFENKKINIGPAVKKESPTIQPEIVMLSQMPVQASTQQVSLITYLSSM